MQTITFNLSIMTGIAAKICRIPAMIKFSSDLVLDRNNRDQLVGDSHSNSSNSSNIIQKISTFVLELIQRFLLFNYDCIWATTPVYRERLINKYAVSDRKILLLPNFIDLQRFESIATSRQSEQINQKSSSFKTESQNIVLLTVSRLIAWKGIEICLEAVSHLEDLPISLRIVGKGAPNYELSLRELAQRLGVSERVEFRGGVPPSQIAEEYRTADIFVLASYFEAFGIVLVEAMAAGVPIVATNGGGIPYVVEDGVSAKLVPCGDAVSLANAIRSLVTSEEKLHHMAIAARSRAKQFDLNIVLDKLVTIYQSLAYN